MNESSEQVNLPALTQVDHDIGSDMHAHTKRVDLPVAAACNFTAPTSDSEPTNGFKDEFNQGCVSLTIGLKRQQLRRFYQDYNSTSNVMYTNSEAYTVGLHEGKHTKTLIENQPCS